MSRPPRRGKSRPPRGGPHKGGGRRLPPPEETGLEAAYIRQLKEDVTPLVVQLTDGTEVEGHIEYYDRDMVKITRPEGPHLFVRKSDIRTIVEQDVPAARISGRASRAARPPRR